MTSKGASILFAVFFSMAILSGTSEGFDREETISLPPPSLDGGVSLEQALYKRASVRSYGSGAVKPAELSQLLWAAQGSSEGGRRTAPSAGALYPLEVHAVVGNVAGLAPGVYRYDSVRHQLRLTAKGDKRAELCDACLGQSPIKNAPVVLVISAFYGRTTVKYGERGIRYAHMEAGHAAQNIYLQAVPLGLGTVVMGAFRDDDLKRLLGMSPAEEPLYVMPVGRKR